MRLAALLAPALLFAAGSCIAPSVVAKEDRAVRLSTEDIEWRAGSAVDLSGTFVSTRLTGPLAASLRKLIYLISSDGSYTGAALIDGAPPHFEVLTGEWTLDADGLRLDGGPPARIEVAPDGSLRLSGEEGRVVLRREHDA